MGRGWGEGGVGRAEEERGPAPVHRGRPKGSKDRRPRMKRRTADDGGAARRAAGLSMIGERKRVFLKEREREGEFSCV